MISVIIVHYKSDAFVLQCIASIKRQKTKAKYEIIVVDNDEQVSFEKPLLQKYPQVRYIRSEKNSGYTGGNNLGAAHAKGEYLFFLNPDTEFASNVLDELLAFLKTDDTIGTVAPLLLDKEEKEYPLQGTKLLGVLNGLAAYSFINSWFPKNPLSKRFWNLGWDKSKVKQVDVTPGTAFLIRKEVFEKVGGFDEQFFLYFDEYDFCRRLIKKGYKNFIIPQAKLIHFWGESTKQRNDTLEIFKTSRKLYYKKYYGRFVAFMVEGLLEIRASSILFLCMLAIAAFLRLYELSTRMLFIGDFAWFYLSARDLVVFHHMPLVGIASSHPWIHQGPLWTYLLAAALALGHFHPVAGGYLAALFGVVTVGLLYVITKRLYGRFVAFFSTLFFATSPLVVVNARMPYHTAPIPLFVLLYLYSLYKWVHGSPRFFALSLFFLTVLYNFELATSILVAPLGIYFLYGLWKKKPYVKKLMNLRVIVFSLLLFVIPLIPMLIYDVSHGFPQTLKYIAWIGYRVLLLFGYKPLHPEIPGATAAQFFAFLYDQIQQFFYIPNGLLAVGILLVSVGAVVMQYKRQEYFLLILSLFIPLLAILAGRVPSAAYMPMLFIQLSLAFGIFMRQILGRTKWQQHIVIVVAVLLCTVNMLVTLERNFFVGPYELYGPSYTQKVSVSTEIAKLANCTNYRIVPAKINNKYESFTMPYEYLTWWLGKPTTKNASVTIEVEEKGNETMIRKL